jgi:hypothetical protein
MSKSCGNPSGVVIDEGGNRLFGLDAEIYLKMQAKRDRGWEKTVLQWVQDVTGEPLLDLDDIWLSLKSGVVLCQLVNKVKPGLIPKFAEARLIPLIEMDNIQLFLQAVWKLGVPSRDLFVTADLYKKKALPNVVTTVQALGVLAPSLGFVGPVLTAAANKGDHAAKKWDAVHTEKAQSAVDDLGTDLEKENTQLQIQVAELNAEASRLKGDRASAMQELAALKKRLGDAKGDAKVVGKADVVAFDKGLDTSLTLTHTTHTHSQCTHTYTRCSSHTSTQR